VLIRLQSGADLTSKVMSFFWYVLVPCNIFGHRQKRYLISQRSSPEIRSSNCLRSCVGIWEQSNCFDGFPEQRSAYRKWIQQNVFFLIRERTWPSATDGHWTGEKGARWANMPISEFFRFWQSWHGVRFGRFRSRCAFSTAKT